MFVDSDKNNEHLKTFVVLLNSVCKNMKYSNNYFTAIEHNIKT